MVCRRKFIPFDHIVMAGEQKPVEIYPTVGLESVQGQASESKAKT
jgi:hypothetical protein